MEPRRSTALARRLAQLDQSVARRQQTVRVGDGDFRFECLDDLDLVIDQTLAQLGSCAQSQAQVAEISPHFGVLWPAAIALANYLDAWLKHHRGAKPRLIELGCGLALPSLVAAKQGASVVASDRHALVPFFLARNAKANGLAELPYRSLDWRHLARTEAAPFDLVVGSDLLYEPWQPGFLAKAIPLLLAPQGRALIADPGRRYVDSFVQLMEAAHYTCELSQVAPVDHGRRTVEVLILSLYRQPRDP